MLSFVLDCGGLSQRGRDYKKLEKKMTKPHGIIVDYITKGTKTIENVVMKFSTMTCTHFYSKIGLLLSGAIHFVS